MTRHRAVETANHDRVAFTLDDYGKYEMHFHTASDKWASITVTPDEVRQIIEAGTAVIGPDGQ